MDIVNPNEAKLHAKTRRRNSNLSEHEESWSSVFYQDNLTFYMYSHQLALMTHKVGIFGIQCALTPALPDFDSGEKRIFFISGTVCNLLKKIK